VVQLLLLLLVLLLLSLLLVNVRLLMLLVLLFLRLLLMPPLQQLVGLSLDMLMRPTLPIRFVLRRMALIVRFLPLLPKFGMTSVPRSVG
jgi:hypothetical protein